MKGKFYWARIGDGNYEPVAVTGKRGKRLAYTIACPDPFEVDVPEPAIKLLEKSDDAYDGGPITVPLTPKQEENARRRERQYRAMQGSHSYAGFGR